jgi:hypothetical protein
VTVPSVARYVTLAAPTGGLNAIDTLASMPPSDAISLSNMVPFTWGVTVRKGFLVHARGLAGRVKSLLPWSGSTDKLYAAVATNLYDVTDSVDSPVPTLTGLTDSLWQHVQMTTAGGAYTIAVNGADDPLLIDGTATIKRLIAGNGTDANTIAGVDPKLFIDVNSHQRRLWFAQKNSTVGWYLPADSVYGTAKAFDFGPLFKRGGTLYGIYTWTVDTGEGSNDHLVALSTKGDAVVYAGTDVDTADAWELKGVYFIGAPVLGGRIDTKVGGDLLLLTTVGVVSMNTIITSTQVNATTNDTLSRKVQMLLSSLTDELADDEGWQLVYTANNNLLMVNVPRVFEGGAGQLVSNQVNQAWCAFSGMDASCWLAYKDRPWFGTPAGDICRAWEGFTDKAPSENVASTPQPIKWRAQQAYSYLDAPALQKQVGLFRMNFLTGGSVEYATAVYYDFSVAPRQTPNLALPDALAYWDVDLWDVGKWTGSIELQRRWDNPIGLGVAVSLALAGISTDEVTWVSTDLSYITGGLL